MHCAKVVTLTPIFASPGEGPNLCKQGCENRGPLQGFFTKAKMAIFVIPAAPGFTAQWKSGGKVWQEPIIAWRIEAEAVNPKPKAIGVFGWCDDNAQIVDPQGKVVTA